MCCGDTYRIRMHLAALHIGDLSASVTVPATDRPSACSSQQFPYPHDTYRHSLPFYVTEHREIQFAYCLADDMTRIFYVLRHFHPGR